MSEPSDLYKIEHLYRLVAATIPLALKQLYAGQVPALDQMEFWKALGYVEDFQDVVDYDSDIGNLRPEIWNEIERLHKEQCIPSGTSGPASLRREIEASQKPDSGAE